MGRFDPTALVRRVDLLTLKLFLTVVEEGQIARAASREHIVPSAVTKRIQELEELVGSKLFDRAPKGAVLTPAGHVVAQHVRAMFESIDRMHDDIGTCVGGATGYLRICANESIIIEFLADEIHLFRRENPDIAVELLPQQMPDMVQHVQMGKVDVGIFASYGTRPVPTIAHASLSEYRRDQLVAVVPRGHALTACTDCSLRDLVEAGLIGLRPAAPFMVHLRKVAEAEGFPLRLTSEATTNESARALVRAGLGVSIQPKGALDFEDHTRISLIPLTADWATRRLYLAVQPRQPPTAATQAFVAQITRHATAEGRHALDVAS